MTDTPKPSQEAHQHYYGKPLAVRVQRGRLTVEIGIDVLAYAVAFSDWANPFDEAKDDYIRTFAITDPVQFAKDVKYAMLHEREDGSTPLSDFLDKMCEAALDDGSTGTDEASIPHGQFAPAEDVGEGDAMTDHPASQDQQRCGGTGMVDYWDGSAYAGEMCRGCVDCEGPDDFDGCDEFCEKELTSHGYTPCRCEERKRAKR